MNHANSSTGRPWAAWVRRRARRLMRLPDADRRAAVRAAAEDYAGLFGRQPVRLTVIRGGRA